MFSYEESEIDFTRLLPGVILIEGINNDNPASSNGSGKSSLFEIINWILFDDTIKGDSKDSVVRLGYKNCVGYLKFQSDEDIIEIEKFRGRKNNLRIKVNGGFISDDKDGFMKNQTEGIKWVNKQLDINFEIWRNSIILGQGDKNSFLYGTHKSRADLVGGILNFSLIDMCLKKVREERIKVIKDKLFSVDERMDYIDSKKQGLENIDVLKQNLLFAESSIESNRRILDKLSKSIIKLEKVKEQADKRIEVKEELEESKKQLREILLGYNSYRLDKKDEIIKIRNAIQGRAKSVTDINAVKKRVKEFEDKIKFYDNSISTVREEISSIKTSIKQKELDVDKIQCKLNTVFSGSESKCPYCGQKIAKSCVEHFEVSCHAIKVEIKKLLSTKEGKELKCKTFTEKKEELNKYLSNWRKAEEIVYWRKSQEREIELLKEALLSRKIMFEKDRKKYGESVAKLNAELESLEDIAFDEQDYLYLIKDRSGRQVILDDLISSFGDIKRELVSVAEYDKDIKFLDKEKKDLLKEKDKNQILEKLFGQQGFRIQMLMDVIPFIESKVNKYLSELDMSHYEVLLEIEGDKFNVNIMDGGLPRPITTYSGGEKKLFTVLFNLALGEIIADRKIGFDFLVLDEAFDELDTLRSQQLVEMLVQLAIDNKKKFFVMTHRSDIKEFLDSHGVQKIVVEKRNGISVIRSNAVKKRVAFK